MSRVVVRAPGKLFVIGEYAVLEGGKALVAAIDAGIRCTAAPARDGRWRLRAPDLGIAADLGSRPGESARGADARAAGLVDAVGEAARLFGGAPLDVVVEAADERSRTKRGLGGSAASVVAVMGAIAAAAGRDPAEPAERDGLFDAASRVHARAQGGRGSGADVAAAVWGGWVGYAPGRPDPLRPPAAPSLAAFWSGRAASTADALRRFDDVRAGEWGRRLLFRLNAVLSRFWSAWSRPETADVLAAVREYGALLDVLAVATGAAGESGRIDDRVPAAAAGGGGHAVLAKPTANHAADGFSGAAWGEGLPPGVAAKTSGAVGGDCAILFGFDAGETERAARSLESRGAERIAIAVDSAGVRQEAP